MKNKERFEAGGRVYEWAILHPNAFANEVVDGRVLRGNSHAGIAFPQSKETHWTVCMSYSAAQWESSEVECASLEEAEAVVKAKLALNMFSADDKRGDEDEY